MSTKRYEIVKYTKHTATVVVIVKDDNIPLGSLHVEDLGLIPIIEDFVDKLNAYTPPEVADEPDKYS